MNQLIHMFTDQAAVVEDLVKDVKKIITNNKKTKPFDTRSLTIAEHGERKHFKEFFDSTFRR